jgi:hypothetical protein
VFWTLRVNGDAVSSRECSYLRGHTGRWGAVQVESSWPID